MAKYVEAGPTVTRDGRRKDPATPSPETAGLVLLYAAEYESFPATVAFGEGHTLVGRSPPGGGISLPQEAISRLHARFTRRGDAWFVADLNSRNGTHVGGRRIAETRLAPNDEVQIGDALFKFIAAEIKAYEPFRIDGVVSGQTGASPCPEVVGGLQMRRVVEQAQRVAPSDLSVLVSGETGTGKELVARAVHRLSGRPGPLHVLNCAELSGARLEAELVGLTGGASAPGTLLLDQVGDLPAESQTTLLRLLATREGRVTGAAGHHRVVSATHHDLREQVKAGHFRGDLYARLGGCELRLPPLRERKEDVYALFRHAFAARGVAFPAADAVAFDFMKGLLAYAWPFNVRELENVAQWCIATWNGRTLAALPESILQAAQAAPSPATSTTPEARRPGPLAEAEVRSLLVRHRGNVSAVARELGKDRAQLHRWLRDHEIDLDDYRPEGSSDS